MKEFIAARPRRFRLIACALLFVAAVLRYWVSYDPTASVPRHPETFRLAYNLYEHGRFANPFIAAETGPSAHLAPVFPGILAGLMLIFGEKGAGMYAIQLAALLVLSLQLSLYPFVSKTLGMGSLTGVIGACAWLVAKPYFFYGWEVFYASLGLAGACCLFRRHLDSQDLSARTWLLGCVMGLLALLLPTALPVLAVWLAWDFWRRRKVFLREFLLPLVLLPALIVLPWTIRNYLVFHRFILVRDDLGLELAVSNNDCAQFAMQLNFNGCFQKTHPNRSAAEAKRALDLGEADYNQLRLREALDWMKSHRRRFAWLTTCRFVAWWLPTESGTLRYVEYAGRDRLLERSIVYLATLLSVTGFVILYRRDVKSAMVCARCLFLLPFIYYIVQYQDRYRMPTLWLTLLLGAYPISVFLHWVWSRLFFTDCDFT